jgi:hypothetical protein
MSSRYISKSISIKLSSHDYLCSTLDTGSNSNDFCDFPPELLPQSSRSVLSSSSIYFERDSQA